MNRSYNRYPDEKGTESWLSDAGVSTLVPNDSAVTTVTPMKRGLKDIFIAPPCEAFIEPCVYNRYPDEKGTESYP